MKKIVAILFVSVFLLTGCPGPLASKASAPQDIYDTCLGINAAENAIASYQTAVGKAATATAVAAGEFGSPAYVDAFKTYWSAHALPGKVMNAVNAAIAVKTPICEADPQPTTLATVDWAALLKALGDLKSAGLSAMTPLTAPKP